MDNPLQDSKTETETKSPPVAPAKRGPGRPRKSEVTSKLPGKRGKPGRPKGDAAIMAEYKARMLASPKSSRVIQKVFEVALDDDHKHQAACMKMVMDRVAPIGAFEIHNRSTGSSGITININSAIDGKSVTIDGEAEDGEWEPVAQTREAQED